MSRQSECSAPDGKYSTIQRQRRPPSEPQYISGHRLLTSEYALAHPERSPRVTDGFEWDLHVYSGYQPFGHTFLQHLISLLVLLWLVPFQ